MSFWSASNFDRTVAETMNNSRKMLVGGQHLFTSSTDIFMGLAVCSTHNNGSFWVNDLEMENTGLG